MGLDQDGSVASRLSQAVDLIEKHRFAGSAKTSQQQTFLGFTGLDAVQKYTGLFEHSLAADEFGWRCAGTRGEG